MDPARFLIAFVMLLGASIWDMRERRIPNLYWFPFVVFAAVYVAVDIEGHAWMQLLGATVVATLSYLFWRFGLWGGADAKGVMILAFLAGDNLRGSTSVAVLDTLVAGMTLVLLIPIGLLIWNLAHRRMAFPAMLIGRVMAIEDAKARRVWPMQDADGWRLRAQIGQDQRSIYRDLEAAGHTQVWATMQLPTMAFIFVGYLLANLFGSPVAWISALRP